MDNPDSTKTDDYHDDPEDDGSHELRSDVHPRRIAPALWAGNNLRLIGGKANKVEI